MLADPTFAEIVHSIGVASLGADDKTIKHLTKVWHGCGMAVVWLCWTLSCCCCDHTLWLCCGQTLKYVLAHAFEDGCLPLMCGLWCGVMLQVFWYTVEFGVVREGDAVKAFGAAILSSYGELEHLAKVRSLEVCWRLEEIQGLGCVGFAGSGVPAASASGRPCL